VPPLQTQFAAPSRKQEPSVTVAPKLMEHPGFFERQGPFGLEHIASLCQATLAPGARADLMITDVRPLSDAGPGHLAFFDNRKYLPQLATTTAAACLVAPAFADRVPAGTVPLISKATYRSFALALQAFYPEAKTPKSALSLATDPLIHPTARIEHGAKIEAGAVVGREAWIGSGTTIAAGAVIGYRVTVGRDSYVGPGASLVHCLIGNRVVIHSGVRAGQDGFGFAMGPGGHIKVPQIGRVIIQDDVEIGANTCIDRGALKDTIIGEGTKIDNLVQIGHNVVVGRHCVIVAQVAIAGSSVLGDYVVLAGQSGVSGHLTVGDGAQLAGASHAIENVPAGAKYVGTPAKPIREWTREQIAIKRLTQPAGRPSGEASGDGGGEGQ
jgi:UDP-3-O-[3-hydroxymyristoyl] glucosamine N-acyltransferase